MRETLFGFDPIFIGYLCALCVLLVWNRLRK